MPKPPTSAASDPSDAGHRIYTRRFLRVYDPLILGFYARWVWRCPTDLLIARYEQHVASPHLDVGPGTGHLLDRADLPSDLDVTLLDPNPEVLTYASERLARFSPETVHADVCEPLPVDGPFASIGLNFVLHCLPGPPERKAPAVRHLADVLTPDGVLFGATILADPERHNRFGRTAMRQLNRRGVFGNSDDTERKVRALLDDAFEDITLDVVGAVGVFTARSPRERQR
jgi:SAM-dependent methyltransferase